MKTINIGRHGRKDVRDIVVHFDTATVDIIPGPKQRPQYCISLNSASFLSAKIYSATPIVHEKLKQLIGAASNDRRIVPGVDVLGVHIYRPSQGYPGRYWGGAQERRAPEFVIAYAPASMPDKPQPQFPAPTEQGIQVIHANLNGLVQFVSYKNLEKIIVQNNMVVVTFAKNKVKDGIVCLGIVTANKILPARLTTLFTKKRPSRFMINQEIIGLMIDKADGKSIVLSGLNSGGVILREMVAVRKPVAETTK